MKIYKILGKRGRITIPFEIREELELEQDDVLSFELQEDGVTQGMVSKWESREYNFTIKTLNEICQKIDLELSVSLEKPCVKSDYTIVRWDSEKVAMKRKKSGWATFLPNKEAIA